MEVKLSQDELKAIAAEVIKQLRASGLISQAAEQPKANVGRKAAAMPKTPMSKKVATSAVAAPVAAKSADSKGGVFNIATAAEAAGQHPNTIRRHITSGRLKSKIVKGAYQIKQSDLESYAHSLSKNK